MRILHNFLTNSDKRFGSAILKQDGAMIMIQLTDRSSTDTAFDEVMLKKYGEGVEPIYMPI